MKIIVLGSNGFIGNHLVDYLVTTGLYEVYKADIHQDYSKKNYFIIDTFQSNFQSIFKANKFDVCINCTGAADVTSSTSFTLRDFQLNTYNVACILDAIKLYNPECRFLNLSSAAVYGNPEKLPIRECYPLHPVSPYGFHKHMAELLCTEYSTFFGLKCQSLRIFSAYGPGLKKQLFWDVYQKTKEFPKGFQMFGSGKESRDFIYITDLVRAIELIFIDTNVLEPVINIASGIETPIYLAVHELANVLEFNIDKIEFCGESRATDPQNWKADIENLKKLGFKPDYSLKNGLKEYAQWLEN
jgi:UDP-glucose 4-epimerase